MLNLNFCLSLITSLFFYSSMLMTFNYLEAGWSSPITVSSTESNDLDISVDIAGNAIAVWQGFDGSNYIVQTSSLLKGGNWTTPITLSDSSQNASGPEVDADYLGNAVVVWSRFDGYNSIIQGTALPFGSTSWSTVVDISDAGENADGVELAMDYSGNIRNAVAVWHRFNGSNFIIQGSVLASGGNWSAPINISASGQDALVPDVAVDPLGNAVMTCCRFNGTNYTNRAATILNGQSWGPNYIISNEANNILEPSIAIDGLGNAITVWTEFDGLNYIVKVATLPFGGSWSSALSLSASGEDAFAPIVAMDLLGNAIVVWSRFNGSNYIAQASRKSIIGNWTTPVNLSSSGQDVGNIDVKFGGIHNAVVVWDITDGSNSKIQATTLPIGGGWSTPVDISTSGNYAYFPFVDVDSSGDAVSIWLEWNGTATVVTSSSLTF